MKRIIFAAALFVIGCRAQVAQPYALIGNDWCADQGHMRTLLMMPDKANCQNFRKALLDTPDEDPTDLRLQSDWSRECTKSSLTTLACVPDTDPRIDQSFLSGNRSIVRLATGVRYFKYR